MTDNRRFVEDSLPIQTISADASLEKSVRNGYISTLHSWRTQRPLAVGQTSVYGALFTASRFIPENGPGQQKLILCWTNEAMLIKRRCIHSANLSASRRNNRRGQLS